MATLDQAIMRGLLSARPANATGTAGRLYFATDENALYRDSGTAWEVVNRPLGTTAITAAAGNHTHAHSALTGIGANDHHNQSHNLQSTDHPDVSTAAPGNGQVWTWNSGISKWEPQTPATSGMSNPMTTAGDVILGGTSGAPTRLAKGADSQVLTVDPTTHLPVWAAAASGGMANPMTTQDDLIIGGASGAATRLPKGSDSQVLTVDPTTHHLVWANIPSGFADPTTTKGDLLVHNATSTTRLGVGTDTQVLTADSSTATGVKWAAPSSSDTRLNGASELFEYDDFLGGSSSSGSIGKLGWTTNGGSSGAVAGATGHPGIIQRTTTTTSGTVATMTLVFSSSIGRFDPADLFEVVFVARLNTNDANTTVQIGLSSSITLLSPSDGIYIEKIDADTQWFGVTRASNSQTRTAALATVDTGWHRFRVRRVDASTIGFSIDGGTEATLTATIPTAALTISLGIKNSAASNKTIDIDYASLRITGLSR